MSCPLEYPSPPYSKAEYLPPLHFLQTNPSKCNKTQYNRQIYIQFLLICEAEHNLLFVFTIKPIHNTKTNVTVSQSLSGLSYINNKAACLRWKKHLFLSARKSNTIGLRYGIKHMLLNLCNIFHMPTITQEKAPTTLLCCSKLSGERLLRLKNVTSTPELPLLPT